MGGMANKKCKTQKHESKLRKSQSTLSCHVLTLLTNAGLGLVLLSDYSECHVHVVANVAFKPNLW